MNRSTRIIGVVCTFAIGVVSASHAADITPDDAKTLAAAQESFDAGKYDAAIRALAPLRSKYPDLADIPRLLTHAYYEQGEFDLARQSALHAIGAGRVSADVLVRIAQIDQQRDDKQALLNVVRLLTVLQPDNRQWRLVHADLLAGSDALTESIAAYRSLIEEQPDSAELQLRLGNTLLKAQRNAEAASTLETAWRLGAKEPRLPEVLAGVCQSLGDDHQALAWLDRASALAETSDPKQKLLRAMLLWKIGDLDRAKSVATPLASAESKEIKGQACVLLGRIAMQKNNVDAAITHWQQAAAAGVESPELLTILGTHYYNADKFAAAAKILRRVVDREDAANEQNLKMLILSLQKAKETRSAEAYLAQYIERNGLSDEAKKLVRLIAS